MNLGVVRKVSVFRQKFPGACHRYSLVMMRLLAKHCEFLATQRIRRASQVIMLYSKIWNESAIEKMVVRLKHEAGNRSKMLMLGAAILQTTTQFDWGKERMAQSELEGLFAEFDDTKGLLDVTNVCRICGERKMFDKAVSWAKYCNCRHKGRSVYSKLPNQWEPFLERSDVVIWRRLLHGKNYEYKVFGHYKDVCAGAWFRINADDKRRRDWDDTCLEIRQVDEDPTSRTQVLYWKSQYPYPMSNRDYVFKKNFILDRKRKMALIFNHETDHPDVPVTKENVRIQRYRSVIVVRPENEFHQDGMEFSITYLDDPGVDLPEIFISYVTVQGFPNYVDKMRTAARKLEKALGRDSLTFGNLMAHFGLVEEKEEVAEIDEQVASVVEEEEAPEANQVERRFVKASRIIHKARKVFGLNEKRRSPQVDVVYTFGPPLYRSNASSDEKEENLTKCCHESDDVPFCEEEGRTVPGNEGYATYWIPLSWLKRVMGIFPIYSLSNTESRDDK